MADEIQPQPEENKFYPAQTAEVFETPKLYILKVYDLITRLEYGLLTATQKTDLTDGGASTLHSHAVLTSAITDDAGVLLTAVQKTDLTDGGASTLHKHDHGGMDGLGDDDHPQYLLAKKSFTAADDITAKTAVNLISNDFDSVANANKGKVMMSIGNGAIGAHFIGYAESAIAKDASGDITMLGVISGLTGLTIGSIYYLKNCAGSAGITISQLTQNADADPANDLYQSFQPTKSLITGIDLYLKEDSGTSSTGHRIRVYRQAPSNPMNGLIIGDAYFSAADVGGSYGFATFVFTPPIVCVPGETLTFLYTSSGSSNPRLGYNTAGGYAGGYFFYGSTETTDRGDACFRVRETDVDGLIDTSAGTVSKKVGIAISTTELLILNTI